MIVLFEDRIKIIEDRIDMLYMFGNRFVYFDRICKEGSIGVGICCSCVCFGNRFVVIEDRIDMLYMLGNRFVYFDRICKEGSIGVWYLLYLFVYFGNRFVYIEEGFDLLYMFGYLVGLSTLTGSAKKGVLVLVWYLLYVCQQVCLPSW